MRKFLHNKNSKILIITLVILTVMSVFSHNGSNIFSRAVNTVTKGLSTLTAGAASSDKSKEELDALWNLVYGSGGPAAAVDFTKEEVLAVFDGSHSSGGYDITVDSVKDEGGVRKIHITHTIPGEGCAVSSAITSPYQIVVVPRSSLPLSRTDATATADCR